MQSMIHLNLVLKGHVKRQEFFPTKKNEDLQNCCGLLFNLFTFQKQSYPQIQLSSLCSFKKEEKQSFCIFIISKSEIDTDRQLDDIPSEPDKNPHLNQLKQFNSIQQLRQEKQFNEIAKKQKENDFRLNHYQAVYGSQKGPFYYITALMQAISVEDDRKLEFQKSFLLHFAQNILQIYSRNQFQPPDMKNLQNKMISMPRLKKKKKTLILDLDETLIHCDENLKKKHDFVISVNVFLGESVQIGVRFRPYLFNFLKIMSSYFEIIVFTASHRYYAEAILNRIDPSFQYISKLLTREQCIYDKGCYIKDLRIFQGRDLSQLIIVDNLVISFIYQIENGVPILPFIDDDNDNELVSLSDFLIHVNSFIDVRTALKQYFQLEKYSLFQETQEAAKSLYQ